MDKGKDKDAEKGRKEGGRRKGTDDGGKGGEEEDKKERGREEKAEMKTCKNPGYGEVGRREDIKQYG